MKENLAQRYEYVFQLHQDRDYFDKILRDRILSLENLRPDAKLFLLVNFKYMIIDPYFKVLNQNVKNTSYNAPIYTNKEFNEKIDLAIHSIVKGLSGERPYSSHDVLNSINIRWKYLAGIFAWG